MKLSRMFIPIVVGLAVGAGAFILILGQEKKTVESPVGNKRTPAVTSAPQAKLLVWNDQAGFTFQYPEGLSVNKHDEDNVNYAHLEFTNAAHPGSLIVWAKDTNAADLSAWIKADKRFTGAPVIDTALAGQPGKKILVATPSAMLVTGTIDQNILFTVETKLTDKEFWTKVHDTISGSFAFTPDNSGQGSGSAAGSADQAVDEEETIQ